MREIIIENTVINDYTDCYVIAEIGNNHQGSLETAREMLRAAKDCGVNAVKLQKRDNRSLFTEEQFNKDYDSKNSFGTTYGEHREKLEFGDYEYSNLKEYAQRLGLTLFATPFDFNSVDFLEEHHMPAYKVASGDIKNIPLLKYIASTGKPMIVSTGGALMADVQRAYQAIMPINKNFSLLQCTASYPSTPEEMNLKVIETYRNTFPDVVVGLSDHQNGIAMALVAYMLGARIIEKHFTLNRAWKGTDHAFSLEPIGMKKLVRDIRRAKVAIGDGVKRVQENEKDPIIKMGKKLVASRDLSTGHIMEREDIEIKSPGDGLHPYELPNILGKKLIKPLKKDDTILMESLEVIKYHDAV